MTRSIVGLCLAFACASAVAQEFPSRPVRIVVPWPPAGNVDITARTVAPAFGEALGQQVIVENRAGAGGRIGSEAVAKSAPDGYTLLLGSSGTVTAGPAVWKNLGFDPLKDFVAVGPIQSVPIVLTVAPKTPARFLCRILRLRQSAPGRAHHRLGRQRLVEPPRHRAPHAAGESQAAARALQGKRPGDH